MQAIYNSVNSLSQLQRQLDVTGHNIANVDTVGFKRQQGHFASLLSQAYNNQPRPEFEIGRDTPNGIRIGVGGHVADITHWTSAYDRSRIGRLFEGEPSIFRRGHTEWRWGDTKWKHAIIGR